MLKRKKEGVCVNLIKTQELSPENQSEKIDNVKLTVKEVADYINESPHVIRNWLRELKAHIPTEQGENGYNYFDEEAINTLLLIQQLSRKQNYTLKQIERYFATDGESFKPEKPLEATDEILTYLEFIKDKLDSQEEQLEAQKEFNKALVIKLEQQQEYISNSLIERDRKLLLAMRESQQAKETVAKSKKKSFFRKWFNKKDKHSS